MSIHTTSLFSQASHNQDFYTPGSGDLTPASKKQMQDLGHQAGYYRMRGFSFQDNWEAAQQQARVMAAPFTADQKALLRADWVKGYRAGRDDAHQEMSQQQASEQAAEQGYELMLDRLASNEAYMYPQGQ